MLSVSLLIFQMRALLDFQKSKGNSANNPAIKLVELSLVSEVLRSRYS